MKVVTQLMACIVDIIYEEGQFLRLPSDNIRSWLVRSQEETDAQVTFDMNSLLCLSPSLCSLSRSRRYYDVCIIEMLLCMLPCRP